MEKTIQLVAALPGGSKRQEQLTNMFIDELWYSLEHPPLLYMGDQFRFRQADGSNNVSFFTIQIHAFSIRNSSRLPRTPLCPSSVQPVLLILARSIPASYHWELCLIQKPFSSPSWPETSSSRIPTTSQAFCGTGLPLSSTVIVTVRSRSEKNITNQNFRSVLDQRKGSQHQRLVIISRPSSPLWP